MKKLTRMQWIGIILAVVILAPHLVYFVRSLQYYPDIETAAKNHSNYKIHFKMATIVGDEGIVYIALSDYDTIIAYSFKTKTEAGNVLYNVAKETRIKYKDNHMVKINTAPDSTEQLVFGTSKALADEYAQKTGINAEYIHFGNEENQYTIWYIISANGLDELPALQLGDGIWYELNSLQNFVPLILLGLVITGLIVIRKKKRANKTKIASDK